MKASDITVSTEPYSEYISHVLDLSCSGEGRYAATFRGPDHRERAEAEAQRMRDALPKPRFEACPHADSSEVWDRSTRTFVVMPYRGIQREFPALVQHICDWLNEQSS